MFAVFVSKMVISPLPSTKTAHVTDHVTGKTVDAGK